MPRVREKDDHPGLRGACMLDQDQIQFIENKVRELGSIEAVRSYYYKDCTVTDYARQFAETVYGMEERAA